MKALDHNPTPSISAIACAVAWRPLEYRVKSSA
jgi:hypothetical protein